MGERLSGGNVIRSTGHSSRLKVMPWFLQNCGMCPFIDDAYKHSITTYFQEYGISHMVCDSMHFVRILILRLCLQVLHSNLF